MVKQIKKDFPLLNKEINGKTICYLDNAASSQKPHMVIDAIDNILENYYANVHRGVHILATKTTIAYEDARKKVQKFINAKSENEIIFTRNATGAINLVASSFGETLNKGDEIIISELEHHANIVPWYFLKEKKGIVLKVIPINAKGELDIDKYEALLSDKTKLVSVTQMSNALGTVTPIKTIIDKAHKVGAKVLVDGSQGAVHVGADVQKLDCDFYVFTGHKLFALTGIGVLYGREALLNSLPPYEGGGEMIEKVTYDKITYKQAPARFEAGTPPIVEAVSLGAAIDYLNQFNIEELLANEHRLLEKAENALKEIGGITIYSNAGERASVLSFNIDGVHPHDAATIFDQMGIAVRVGHHCAQPLMARLGIEGTIRASFAIYNDDEDVTRFVESITKIKKMFL